MTTRNAARDHLAVLADVILATDMRLWHLELRFAALAEKAEEINDRLKRLEAAPTGEGMT